MALELYKEHAERQHDFRIVGFLLHRFLKGLFGGVVMRGSALNLNFSDVEIGTLFVGKLFICEQPLKVFERRFVIFLFS